MFANWIYHYHRMSCEVVGDSVWMKVWIIKLSELSECRDFQLKSIYFLHLLNFSSVVPAYIVKLELHQICNSISIQSLIMRPWCLLRMWQSLSSKVHRDGSYVIRTLNPARTKITGFLFTWTTKNGSVFWHFIKIIFYLHMFLHTLCCCSRILYLSWNI